MPNDLFIPVQVPTTTTEEVGVTLKELSLLAPDAEGAGVIALVLAPLDENGNWRNDVQPVLVRIADKITPDVDDEGNEIPIPSEERYAATVLQQMMFSAIVTDTPTHQSLGIVGMSVWDAAKHIAPNYLPQPEGEDA